MTKRYLSRYLLEEEVGRGGMGIVYRAHDEVLGRDVAVKVLPPLAASENARKRFVLEARAASSLDHPNICTVYDLAEDDSGETLLVMPLYRGQTLAEMLARGPLPSSEVRHIGAQILDGLSAAHQAGIVHRDVKPANIFVTDDGSVKILDFGVAKLGAEADLTRDGFTVGTAAYMSPEQASGGAVDHRSDFWSLGVILFECLSGSRPFQGAYEQAVVYGIVNTDAPGLENDMGPEDLRTIVAALLSKDPADRPGLDDARAVLRPQTESHGTTVKPEPASGQRKMKRQLVLVAGFLILAAVLAASLLRRSKDKPVEVLPAMAVLPFDVQSDGSIDYLRDGMASLLSVTIDGMGDLRSVDPLAIRTLLTDLDAEVVDETVVREVLARFNPEGVVTGTVVKVGNETRINASVYGSDGIVADRAEALAAADSLLPGAIDDIARQLISGRFSKQQFASVAAVTTRNFDALRHFLKAQALARDRRLGAARAEMELAIAADTTFALAYLRKVQLTGWLTEEYSDVDRRAALAAAVRHSGQLTPKLRALVDIQSLWMGVNSQEALALAESLLEQHPEDANIAWVTGDLQYHVLPQIGRSGTASLAALQRSYQLDPSGEVAQHLLQVAIQAGQWDAADSLLAQLIPGIEVPRGVFDYVVRAERDGLSAVSDEILEYAASVSESNLGFNLLGPGLAWCEERYHPGGCDLIIEAVGVDYVDRRIARGRLQEGFAALDVVGRDSLDEFLTYFPPIFLEPEHQTYGFPSEALQPRDYLGEPVPASGPFLSGMWALQQGDADAFASALDSLGTASPERKTIRDRLRALDAWYAGDFLEVLRILEADDFTTGSQKTMAHRLYAPLLKAYMMAEALNQTGRHKEALAWFEIVVQSEDRKESQYMYQAPAMAGWGEALDALGRTTEAVEVYSQFIDLWDRADPVLQPRVQRARDRVFELLSEEF